MHGTKRRIVTYKDMGNFLTHIQNCEHKTTIGIVKLSLTIPQRHNGVVPIKITGQTIKHHMAYFITDENSTKESDPNINIISVIHCIKGKTSVNVLACNYTNKHIKFNKGQYIGCLEPTTTDSMPSDQPETHSTNGVNLQKMVVEQVQQEAFYPPCHNLKPSTEFKLKALLKEYALQFTKDKMTKGTTPFTEMIWATLLLYPRNLTQLQ